MTRLPVADHQTPAEIDRRCRTCTDAAAKVVGYTPAWGRAILKRHNAGGPDALADGRRGDGTDPKLTPDQQAGLFAALQADPPDGGLWSGPKVAAFVRDRFGVEAWPQTGWRWLKDLGLRLVAPPPGTRGRPPPTSSGGGFDRPGERMAELRRENPDEEVEWWCEDGARLGPEPAARRVWALRGTRPTSNGRHEFESLSVYGFAHPKTGRGRCLVRPRADAACPGEGLADHPEVVGGAVGSHGAVAA